MEGIFKGLAGKYGGSMISLEKRDCLARIAELEVEGASFKLPLMINFLDKDFELQKLLEKMDFGIAPYVLKKFDEGRFEKLRSKNKEFIIGTGLRTLLPRDLAETLLELRERDYMKVLYTPALATPQNLPMLIYFGVDMVDNILPIISAYKGVYMLGDAELRIDLLKDLPCNCWVCSKYASDIKSMEYGERSRVIALHNTAMLESQLKLVKEQIRAENLRNFVEFRSKASPQLTVMLRVADENIAFFQRFNAIFKRSTVLITSEYFTRPEIVTFFKRALFSYKPESKILLLLPCTATKPYSVSRTHRAIKTHINLGVNEIIVSSPLVVPRELELVYPAVNYDTPVTGHWSDDEISFVAKKLTDFILKGNFEKVIAHVEGGYKKVVEKVSSTTGFDIVFTAQNGILSNKSIKKLKKELEEIESKKIDLFYSLFQHMVRYQYGVEFELESYRITGRYPHLELFSGEKRLMRVDVRYGMLDIDLPFARLLLKKEVYTARIGDFTPKGTIFAAGVLEADERIRPNDIVVFYNDKMYGVGMSYMCGSEMVEAERGAAIKVKRRISYEEGYS
jgi:archaeosine synthase